MIGMSFLIGTFIFVVSLFISPQNVQAYLPFSAAETAYIEAEDPSSLNPGMLVAREGDVFRLTDVAYDAKVLGVIVETADIVVQIADEREREQHIVATSGELLVFVNASSGEIVKGDFITSSNMLGIGMKAKSGGVVLGTALEDYTSSDPEEIGTILVRIDVHALPSLGPVEQFVRTSNDLFQFGPQGLSNTSSVVRYILAIGIVLIMVLGGFYMFGRIALRGIDALGRNPLARTTIMTGIIINSLLTVTVVVIGFVIAYIIITL
jgi:F0F1-type ATP synthase membrane subunit c/vacuolar-type H+-ATPase subunit K